MILVLVKWDQKNTALVLKLQKLLAQARPHDDKSSD